MDVNAPFPEPDQDEAPPLPRRNAARRRLRVLTVKDRSLRPRWISVEVADGMTMELLCETSEGA